MNQIIELIQKEEEKYQLTSIGAINDLKAVTEVCVQDFHKIMELERKAQLQYFYNNIVNYSTFLENEKKSNKKLENNLKQQVVSYLTKLRNTNPAILDKELKTGQQITIAYFLSENIFNLIYSVFSESSSVFETPEDLRAFFCKETDKKYPIRIAEFIRFLEENDNSFWETVCIYIKPLSTLVSKTVIARSEPTKSHDIIIDSTWSDAYEILQKRLVDKIGNIPIFLTGTDFRNYIIKICTFLALNSCKKYTEKESYIEDTISYSLTNDDEFEINTQEKDYSLLECNIEEKSSTEEDIKELNINVDNAYEVAYAVSIILLNTDHPLHYTLTEGLESKVKILIEKTVNGLSYNEIIEDLYGPNIDEENFKRAVVKARKEYERVRKTLVERLISIISKRT